MLITINLLEAASELAHQKAYESMVLAGFIEFHWEMWEHPNAEELNYTALAQGYFNDEYDRYYNELYKLKITIEEDDREGTEKA